MKKQAAAEPILERFQFFIEGMHCASCVSRIERSIQRLDGVADVRVNPGTSMAIVRYMRGRVRPIDFRRAIERSGPYRAVQLELRRGTSVAETDYWVRHEEPLKMRMAVCAVLSGIVVAITWHLSAQDQLSPTLRSMQWVLFAGASVIQWWGGWSFHTHAWKAVRRGVLDMNSLVSVGSFAAYGASVVSTVAPGWLLRANIPPQYYYEASSLIITFIIVGRWFESRARRTAGDALQSLQRLQPPVARVVRGGEERRVPVEEVKVGERFVLRPGDRVPLDGLVEEGHSFVNQAAMTGESTSVDVTVGSAVMSGTHNLRGRLICRATRVGRDTRLAQLFQLIEDAQTTKVPVQRFADRVAGMFVPVVMVMAAVTAVVWWIWGPAPQSVWAISSAVAVLIVACPCALGLATPLAVMIGVARGARHNILLRNPAALEVARALTDIVFDKTGTLTRGHPVVTTSRCRDGETLDDLIQLTASVEQASEHPLAAAVVDLARGKNIPLLSVTQFEAQPGLGASAQIHEQAVLVGNAVLMARSNVVWGALEAEAQAVMARGDTPVIVAVDRDVRAVFGVADQLKPDAPEAVRELTRRGLTLHIISGDHHTTTEAVARALGITNIRAECLPQDKIAYVQQLRSRGRRVAMVGDGINDAPALVQADLSIALGQSTDLAAETGDIVLLRNDLRGVVQSVDLSQRMMRTIGQNLFWAFAYNLLMIPLAAGVLYPLWHVRLTPWLAGAAMASSSLSVVLNSLRLRRS